MTKIREICFSIFGGKNKSVDKNNKGLSEAIQDVLNLLKDIEVNTFFRVFGAKDNIRQWGIENYSLWEQNLTLEEIKNIKLYTLSSFKFNTHLRRCRFPSYKSRIQHIDSALEKSSTPENIITYRWMDLKGFQDITGSASIDKGTALLEKGYSSTTLVFNGNPQYCPDEVLFILKIPKYFNGACLKNISKIQAEDEFLLKRNTVYTVEEIIYNTDTRVILLCNVK